MKPVKIAGLSSVFPPHQRFLFWKIAFLFRICHFCFRTVLLRILHFGFRLSFQFQNVVSVLEDRIPIQNLWFRFQNAVSIQQIAFLFQKRISFSECHLSFRTSVATLCHHINPRWSPLSSMSLTRSAVYSRNTY